MPTTELNHDEPALQGFVTGEADALIREARRRARRRRAGVAAVVILAVLALVLVLGGGGGGSVRRHTGGAGAPGSAASQRHPGTVAAARPTAVLPYISDMGLFGRGTGWAANGVGFYLTSDNGAHWRKVPAFKGDVVANLGPVTSAGREHLFAAEDGGHGYGTCGHPTHPAPNVGIFAIGVVLASSDGGASWRASTVPGCALAFGLSFVSTDVGFALTTAGGWPDRGSLDLTMDGARSWRRVAATPFVGPIDFTSRLDGWGVAAPGTPARPLVANGALYRTTDGGRTWRRVPICAGAATHGVAVICGTPRFFDKQHGVVPAGVIDRRSGRDSFVVFATSDGGARWSRRTLPADPDLRDYFSTAEPLSAINGRRRLAVPFSAAAPADWLVFIGPHLYATRDAGRHWSTITPRPTFTAPQIAGSGLANNTSEPLAFASPSDGWVIADWSGQAPVFDYSTDGGRTWAPLAKQ